MRIKAMAAIAAAALAATLTTAGAASATGTATSLGSVVLTEPNSFLQQSAGSGIIVLPLPSATAAYDSTAGASATFPVTAGAGSIPQFYGDLQLGGGLLIVDAFTHKAVTFHDLHFSIDNYYLTGVPDGFTTAVPLVDVGDNTLVSHQGAVPQTLASDANIDGAGGAYLDSALHTSFFGSDGSQVLGSIGITFTPAS